MVAAVNRDEDVGWWRDAEWGSARSLLPRDERQECRGDELERGRFHEKSSEVPSAMGITGIQVDASCSP